ncbi:Sister chromatid cohesion 1 protein 3 [Acorus calamus]|uniref:Sister chromatid cohesion 1 protein 3 n=1 Tax=Acorus calamus TaxID=4465 RepID=A0AAV9CED7_ACOCL|nr:Sister chromatid cohesion 1 protein 3 [Acorus calamus]
MFYSQFILAKKGPLGTIWIAAHLERKLRKNQVADTDIGVSVDSILFPEVPIALRLSSHLLLGVVRIYSRKVNYLFHDCSEALLKIKQAFRSTAVDLPPEESTAPYHSITLPETFDLDDFELPDSVFLQGNYVDHHVSTREQITLQDNVACIGLSTSKFGLDERFGDGDASQIGLDIDEDILLDKGQHDATLMDLENPTSADNGKVPYLLRIGKSESLPPCHDDPFISSVECQTSGQPATPFANMELDDCEDVDGDRELEASKEVDDHEKHIFSNIPDSNRCDASSPLRGYNIQTPDLNEMVFPCENIEESPAVPAIGPSASAIEAPPTDLLVVAQAPSTPGLVEEAIPASVQEVSALSLQKKTSLSNSWEVAIPDTASIPCLDSEDCDPKNLGSEENLFAQCSSPNGMSSEAQGLLVPTDNLPQIVDMSQVVSLSTSEFVEPESTSIEPKASKLNDTPQEPDVIQACNNSDIGNVEPKRPSSSHDPDPITCAHGHVLQSCSSMLDEVNQSFAKDGMVVENVSLLSSKETCTSEGLGSEMVLNSSGHAVEVPGDLDVQNTSICMQLEINSDNNNSAGIITTETRPDPLNFSTSSDFPEPEKLRAAPVADLDLPNDLLGQTTFEKGPIESDGSVDRISTLSGRKRHSMESTPVLQDGNVAKFSRRPRSRKNVDILPDDDDLLSSILGMSSEITDIPIRIRILSSLVSRKDRNHSSIGVSKDLKPPQNPDINQEARMDGTGDLMASVLGKADGDEATCEAATSPQSAPPLDLPNDDQILATTSMEIDRQENWDDKAGNHDMPSSSPHPGHDAPFDEVLDDNTLCVSGGICVENDESTLKDSSVLEDPRMCGEAVGMVHESSPQECIVEAGSKVQVEDDSGKSQSEIAGKDEVFEKVLDDEPNPSSTVICAEGDPQFNMDKEHITSGYAYIVYFIRIAESSYSDVVLQDFGSRVEGNDTEFLNMDDETELNEEADNDIPDTEENQFLDNSGWSSRTRNVARYLKTLFDSEAKRERKVIPMERLLAGSENKRLHSCRTGQPFRKHQHTS